MPKWDFKCPQCGWVIEFTGTHCEVTSVVGLTCPNTKCTQCPMERQPSTGLFFITGYNAQNGYSK